MAQYRKTRFVVVGFAAAAVLLAASPARSEQPALSPSAQQLLLQRVPAGGTLERYLGGLRSDFFQLDADADGQITQHDIDLHTLMEAVQARNLAVNNVMRYDLDGDGFVTEDEIRRHMNYDLRGQLGLAAFNTRTRPQIPATDFAAKQIDAMVRAIMVLDSDNDGKVSVTEAAKFGTTASRPRGQGGQSSRARQLLDMSSTGVLSLTDYESAGEAFFRKIDADNDGTISQQELMDFRTRAERAGCEMPTASDKAKVVVLSSYQTEALSSATLGSQDAVVHAGRIVVEPGSEPLYLVVITYAPTVWQFSGAVERVERVVVTSALTKPGEGANRRASYGLNGADTGQPPLGGVTGISKERVSFFGRPGCLKYFSETPTSASLQTVAAIRTAVGKAPATVAAKYSVGSFKVPSGEIEAHNEKIRGLIIHKGEGTLNVIGDTSNLIIQSGPSRAKEEMYRFWPGGVIEIDPKTVVGSAQPERYEVLPAQAGLVQLLSSGALSQNGAGEYIVREKTRFPAGLTGAHAVTFLVLRGTPYPDGDPGHSCVVVEESGTKKGANCR